MAKGFKIYLKRNYLLAKTSPIPYNLLTTTSLGERCSGMSISNLIYDKQNVRLYHNDCVEGMRKYIDTDSVDVIVTSPPYNIDIEYSKYEDNKPYHAYLGWMHEVALEMQRVLKQTGSLFLNIGGNLSDPWKPFDVANQFRFDFTLQNTIIWVKSISLPVNKTMTSTGHYRPIGSKRFLSPMYEYIFHFTKTGNVELDKDAIGVPYEDKTNIKRKKGTPRDVRDRGNTWFLPYETIRSSQVDRPHPASFPSALPEMCIKAHGLHSKLVIDPFNGIGNSAIAAVKLGIPYIGFDIDEEYLQTTVKYIHAVSKAKREQRNTENWW